jgi:glycosyltransferase involved in cell wall biosynthesis
VKTAHTPNLPERKLLGSVVIPAHDEASVIGRCLDALFESFGPGRVDVVAVCNGCPDDTAARARSSGHPVRVLELPAASKPAALREGDAAALAFSRIYLDADVVLPGAAARVLLERLRAGAVAGRPPIRYDSVGASAPVRSYYRVPSRVPAVLRSLWGAGVYGLSADGRSRFGEFPDVVGDDLWVDRLFDGGEVEIVDCAPVVVTVPRRTGDLMLLLRRTYRGKAEPAPDPEGPGPATMPSTLRDLGRLAAAGPGRARDAVTYGAFAAGARLSLAVAGGAAAAGGWERDESSRAA